MKSLLIAALVIGIAGFCSPRPADAMTLPTGLYAVARVGPSFDNSVQSFSLSDDSTMGAGVGAYVGPVRVEGAVDRISADTSSISAHALDYHADAFLDVPFGHLTVYGGAGVDYLDAEASFGPSSIKASGKGWNYVAGASYPLTDRLTAEAQVRHLNATLTYSGHDLDVSSNIATVGLRVRIN